MSHGRPPRRQRWAPSTETLAIARHNAQLLSQANRDDILQPLQAAFTALREGVATELQWATIAGNVALSIAIEELGVVRGLMGHLTAADLALAGINRRAMASGCWKATALYYEEIDNIREGISLYRYQLTKLSRGEYLQAVDKAEANVRSRGGRVVDAASVCSPQIQP